MARFLKVWKRRRTFDNTGNEDVESEQLCQTCCPKCGYEQSSTKNRKEIERNLSLAEREARKLRKSLHKICVISRETEYFDWESNQEISRLGELISLAEKKGDFLELAECTQDLNQLKKDVKTCNRLAKEEARVKQGKKGGFFRRVGSFPDVIRRTFSKKDVIAENGIQFERKPGVDLNTAMADLQDEIFDDNASNDS
mmetsp:Transcript_2701/g.3418  ORF Transcript_2701/g.3418 Transcript_2701/m.3418 type:complete len:198 (+) Transcript_2701:320-913(+)|eukprot:CAMPEP_0204856130 /NCGR_PEP_ID=MMETSP1347-20130617/17791_1 /ASSEMBLY_ACC=CAM_ASM_000690 /TAXON_ID=215587 /ORGANISM="Aplanochytrium stocchinoi, Strain GSBS06" /LENGTH=197 /DNA_ID=CAMNT_0052002629 /DNA_START=200 /DNA_END=793 /DNA_ORIENTATION=+